MPVELALDLAVLALYDVCVYVDDSASMKVCGFWCCLRFAAVALEAPALRAIVLSGHHQHIVAAVAVLPEAPFHPSWPPASQRHCPH